MRRGPAVVLLLLLLLSAGYGAQRAGGQGWARLSGFAPAHTHAPRPTAGPAPMADRVVLILVDGLRLDDVLRLPSLEYLARQGARFRLSVPAPASPAPAMATLLSGAPPVLHGLLLPPARPLAVDNIVAAAARAQIPTAGVGGDLLGAMVGRNLATWTPAQGSAVLDQSKDLLGPAGPRLLILQTDQLHQGSHQLKATDPESSEYKDLLGGLDAFLVQILQTVDRKKTAILVAGTFPTASDGTHPQDGQVPLILAGAGIKPAELADASLTDLAPTVAALLGAPTPLESQGQPLMSALNVQGRPADVVAQRWLAARSQFATAELQAFGADTAPDAPTTLDEAPGYLQGLEKQVTEARFAYWKRIVPARLPYLGGILLLLLLYLVVVYRQPFSGPALWGSLTYLAVFHLLFFLTGGRYSPAIAGLDNPNSAFVLSLGAKIVAAMAAAAAVTGFSLARRGFRKNTYRNSATLHMALSTAVWLALPIVVSLSFVLWDFPVQLPAPGLLIWFFITALQVMVIGYLGLVWVVASALASRLAGPPKESAGGTPKRDEARRPIPIHTPGRPVRR